jgi:hypothetical protein
MNGGDDLMTLFYAAVTSVQDGNVGEIEVQRSVEDRDAGTITTVTVYVRREPLVLGVITEG